MPTSSTRPTRASGARSCRPARSTTSCAAGTALRGRTARSSTCCTRSTPSSTASPASPARSAWPRRSRVPSSPCCSPPVGAFLLTVGRVANAISLACSAFKAISSVIQSVYTAIKMAKETNPLRRLEMMKQMKKSVQSGVGAGLDILMSKIGGKGGKGRKVRSQEQLQGGRWRQRHQGLQGGQAVRRPHEGRQGCDRPDRQEHEGRVRAQEHGEARQGRLGRDQVEPRQVLEERQGPAEAHEGRRGSRATSTAWAAGPRTPSRASSR